MTNTLKTIIHNFYFDLRQPDELAEWKALQSNLIASGVRCMESHGGGSHYNRTVGTREVELETSHLFDNQWNTAPILGVAEKGLRVFDWALDYQSHIGAPKHVKRGHWLEQTAEMREIRRNTCACGYCGKQRPAAAGDVFCMQCIDSEYLKETDLHLTRMLPVENSFSAKRAALSAAERDYLLPLYRDAQMHGSTERGKARKAKQRLDIAETYARSTKVAKTKHDGLLWLLDNGFNIDNVIYYDHTDKFSFGWRKPLGEFEVKSILERISEFPFNYEIKCDNGRTLG